MSYFVTQVNAKIRQDLISNLIVFQNFQPQLRILITAINLMSISISETSHFLRKFTSRLTQMGSEMKKLTLRRLSLRAELPLDDSIVWK